MEEERDQLEQAIARSLVELRGSAPEPSSEDTMVLERDDEGILEEETEFFRQRFLQQGQWRVNYLNEPWQLAKRLLIQQDLWPNKFRAHPQQHSFIKSPNVAPKKLFRITGDGSCMFRCLSYAIFKNEDCHREIRRLVLQHMKEIWDEEPQVRLLAAMWYQHITLSMVISASLAPRYPSQPSAKVN